ncbi:MAG: hypothetical protein DRO16_00400 [Thermoprotei archaeon]|nr:MAG: hypothetical protein DRO16_00400 [Thermoprotei archaeon]
MNTVKILIDLAKSPRITITNENAIELLECIIEKHGMTRDLEEALRIVNNFDEYYRILRKKFEDYISPPKNQRDVIEGRVIVHKLKLFTENNEKKIEIVFDRRVDLELLKTCLEEIGYEEIVVEKQLF